MTRQVNTHVDRPHRAAVANGLRIAVLVGAPLLPASALAQRGDVNCDGALNHFDVEPFVLALIDPAAYAAAYPNCNVNRADMNGDTLIDGLDAQPFVAALLGPPCPPGMSWCDPVCVDLSSDSYNCGACYRQCAPNEVCAGGVCQGI